MNIDLKVLALMTPEMVGADTVNEAALLEETARKIDEKTPERVRVLRFIR